MSLRSSAPSARDARDESSARGGSIRAAFLAVAAVIPGCASGGGQFKLDGYLTGRNYSYAVYDQHDALLHSPIEHLRREMDDRERAIAAGAPGVKPISDVYVLVHGWNYTVEESFRLYEGYRYALEKMLERIRADGGPASDWEPYFVFVVWSSVTRPLSDATESILPWTPPAWLQWVTGTADALAFHIPSAWGESQDAMRIALGQPARWARFTPGKALPIADETAFEKQAFDLYLEQKSAQREERKLPPPATIDSEYDGLRALGIERARLGGFKGFELPLSVVLDELITIRGGEAEHPRHQPRLHVVGHSYGGKLAALATHDAVQRRIARQICREGASPESIDRDTLVDSLLLILPAMQVSEMYWELKLPSDRVPDRFVDAGVVRERPFGSSRAIRYEEVARRIGDKVLVHSRHDSANGWVFALGDVVLDHDAVASAQHVLASHEADHLFYAAYEKWFQGRDDHELTAGNYVAFPFFPVYGALQLASRAVAAVAGTVANDLSALGDGLVVTWKKLDRDIDDERSDAWDVTRDALGFPLAPFLVQRSAGNQGFEYIRPLVNFADPTSWIDAEAVAYLTNHERRGAGSFERLTRGMPGDPPDPDDGPGELVGVFESAQPAAEGAASPWIVYNGRSVYNGALGRSPLFGNLLNVLPPGAHGDLRKVETARDADIDRIRGPGEDEVNDLVKRDRTFLFVHNVTRRRAPR